MPAQPTSPRIDGVLLRTARADDAAGLVRLADLDSAPPLPGPTLVAEANGAIVAALCLSTGRAIANPFVPSLHLVALLRDYVPTGRARPAGPRARPLPRLALRAGHAFLSARH